MLHLLTTLFVILGELSRLLRRLFGL